MSDGHTGISNQEVNRGTSSHFQLVLSVLNPGRGPGEFILHATSNMSYSSGLQPREFLESIGLSHFHGSCQFHRDECFYRAIATLTSGNDDFRHMIAVQHIHGEFNAFSTKIDELFRLVQQQADFLTMIRSKVQSKSIFAVPPLEIQPSETDIPIWVNAVKFPRLRQLETEKATLQKDIDALFGFLPLLYGTGTPLEDAVINALSYFGLKAIHAPKAFTADVFAETQDGSRKFGLEVTGINGPVKKDSKKLTQLLEFERIKEHGEKTILVANTHNTTPVSERLKLEDFTTQVVEFLGRHPILLMTGGDLYYMVGDVLAEKRTKQEIIDILYTTTGKLTYEVKSSL